MIFRSERLDSVIMEARTLLKKALYAWIVFFSLPASAIAAGFQMADQGPKAVGMGGAFTAVADDASALWYNPAGIAFQPGGQVMLGGNAIIARGRDFEPNLNSAPGSSSTLTASRTHFLPQAYISYYDEDWPFAFGIGINSPFHLSTEWPASAPFTGAGKVAEINMFSFNPNVAVRFTEHFAAAVGASYYLVKDFEFANATQSYQGDGDAFAVNVALLYKRQGWSVGGSYRSRSIRTRIEGLVGFAFPDQANVGVAYRPYDNLQISVDAGWVDWQRNDVLRFRGASPFNLVLNWDSTFSARAGVDWEINPVFRVRFGYAFDPTPINDIDFSPYVPDSDRHVVSIGLGYDLIDDLTFDFGYAFIFLVEHDQLNSADTTINGTYQSNKLHTLTGALSYRF